jgi:hypothetical protein
MSTSTHHSNSSTHHSGHAVAQHLPPHWEPTPIRPLLPVGVAIFSVLIALAGIVVVVSGALFLLNAFLPGYVPSELLILHSVDVLGAAILLLVGAVLIAVASALWHQERWALWTTIVVLFFALSYLFFTASITILFLVFQVLFIYLLAVRRHFY